MKASVKREMDNICQRVVRPWDDELAESIEVRERVLEAPEFDVIRQTQAGLLLGAMAGCTSLMLNVIGSALWPAISGQVQHPLRIIQVYLTFPLGESALQLESGFVLALGCVLYIVTGMFYGALLVPAISYLLPRAGVWWRFVACSVASLLLWAINFYLLLLWIQPVFFGGRWIYELMPWWVAALTHIVFGGTIALLYPITASIPDKRSTTTASQ